MNGIRTRYTYDSAGLLVCIEDGRGELWTAEYDAIGRRIRCGRGARQSGHQLRPRRGRQGRSGPFPCRGAGVARHLGACRNIPTTHYISSSASRTHRYGWYVGYVLGRYSDKLLGRGEPRYPT
ncbi:hypothetical protein JQX13_06590 [Archangium violaceum]|nr:hypothetical protein JQX13_06590 [Archangium violaceum]